MYDILKLFKKWQPLYYFFIEKNLDFYATQNDQLAQLAADALAALLVRYQPYRAHPADDQSTLVQQPCL